LNRFIHRLIANLIPLDLLICFLSVSCVLTPTRGSETSEHRDYLNGGYYLLHHLCEDEAKLPLLLDVKDAPPEIEKYAVHISKTAKESITALERLQENDPHLNFDKNPLPRIERDVRESIQAINNTNYCSAQPAQNLCGLCSSAKSKRVVMRSTWPRSCRNRKRIQTGLKPSSTSQSNGVQSMKRPCVSSGINSQKPRSGAAGTAAPI